jgi:acyl-CoA thioesterase FadM
MNAPFTPTAADIDELGHINNAVWVRWIQDRATAHWIWHQVMCKYIHTID